jgi:hypothetical protein
LPLDGPFAKAKGSRTLHKKQELCQEQANGGYNMLQQMGKRMADITITNLSRWADMAALVMQSRL